MYTPTGMYDIGQKPKVPKIKINGKNDIKNMFCDVSPLNPSAQKFMQLNTAPNFYKTELTDFSKVHKVLETHTSTSIDPKQTYEKLKEIIKTYENQIENLQKNLNNT